MEKDVRDQAAQLAASFRGKAAKVSSKMGKAIVTACLIVERYAKENMTPNGPSAPGEFPAVDTGRLRASITHRVETGMNRTVGYVGTNVEYGPLLEFGTSKMAARPFMTPSLEMNRAQITRIIGESVSMGLNGDGSLKGEEE